MMYLLLLSSVKVVAQTKCQNAWGVSFQNFISYRDSVEYTVDYKVDDSMIVCLDDTVLGMKTLGEYFFWVERKKMKNFLYSPTYLNFTTGVFEFGGEYWFDKSLSRSNISGYLPVEMVKVYYISALFFKDFTFKEKIKLGEVDGSRYVGDRNYPVKKDDGIRIISKKDEKEDRKILRSMENSLEKWLNLLDEKGLDYLRKENIDPLHFSNLKWY